MRLIVTVAAVTLISLTVIGVGWVAERNAREALTEEVESRLLMEARNLAHVGTDALLSEFPELTLCPVVSEIQDERTDLAFVVVLDHEGLIKGHADVRLLGTAFELPAGLTPVDCRQNLTTGESIQGNAELLVASVPAVYGDERVLGTALVGLRRDYLETMVRSARKELILFTAGLLAAGIASALVLMSLLLRPIAALRRGLERIGQGDLDTPLRLRDRTELGLLAEAVNGMASELKASQAEMIEKERLDHEMELARGIQQSLLPEAAATAGEFVIDGSYQAAAEVGGDYYDVFELPDGKIGVVIADVAGKGLSGCLVTSMIAVLLRSLRDVHTSPAALLVALEDGLSESLQPGVFITMFYGLLDPARGCLTFASAAHSPLLVYRAEQGTTEWYRTEGIPLGAVKGGALRATLKDTSIDLSPGDLAIQFTDGLNEAADAESAEEFGFDRIAKVVAASASKGQQTVVASLQESIKTWAGPQPPGDDQTILVISREGAPCRPRHQEPLWDSLLTADNLNSRENLAEALSAATWLTLRAEISELTRLGTWLLTCPGLRDLPDPDRHLAEASLYELCANIVEHGYEGDASGRIDIWWQLTTAVRVDADAEHDSTALCPTLAADLVGRGFFLICDQGAAYDPTEWGPPDLDDPDVRKQGRGLGLEIVRSSMKQVVYLPDTEVGNLTMLRFDPAVHSGKEGVCNV